MGGDASVVGSSGLQPAAQAAAEMYVGGVRVRPHGRAELVVHGSIAGASTFGWTVVLELVGREGNRGRVTFTESAEPVSAVRPGFSIRQRAGHAAEVELDKERRLDVDIKQLDDAWPDAGSFTAYDTPDAGAATRNGAVDENGTFLAGPLTFSGSLASFPIVAGPKARGVWDVFLWTSVGSSGWEGVETRLSGGTITIDPGACASDSDCADGDSCTADACVEGTCRSTVVDPSCTREGAKKKRSPR